MNFELFLTTLPIMLKGMLGIFIVTSIIILAMLLLNKFTNSTGSKEENDNDK